jgi:hypothetical protein
MFWNEQKRFLKALAMAEGAVQKLARYLGRNVPCSHCPFYVYKGCQREEATARKMVDVLAVGDIGEAYGPKNALRRNVTYDGYTAVLSLYKFENKETWLLTGWKDGPVDAPGAVNAPDDTQSRPSGIQDALGATDGKSIAPLGVDGKPLFQSRGTDSAPRGWTDFLSGGRCGPR